MKRVCGVLGVMLLAAALPVSVEAASTLVTNPSSPCNAVWIGDGKPIAFESAFAEALKVAPTLSAKEVEFVSNFNQALSQYTTAVAGQLLDEEIDWSNRVAVSDTSNLAHAVGAVAGLRCGAVEGLAVQNGLRAWYYDLADNGTIDDEGDALATFNSPLHFSPAAEALSTFYFNSLTKAAEARAEGRVASAEQYSSLASLITLPLAILISQ